MDGIFSNAVDCKSEDDLGVSRRRCPHLPQSCVEAIYVSDDVPAVAFVAQ